MSSYEEAINIIRAKISPENSCHCKDSLHLEFGVEYTGVNHGGRHVEWYYEDIEGESLENALRSGSRKSLRGKNPKIVYRLTSLKGYLED